MCPLERVDPLRGLAQRFVPTDAPPATAGLAKGVAQPIRIVLQVGERGGLGADMPAAEWVFGVALDALDATSLRSDPDATCGLAKAAGRDVRCHGFCPLVVSADATVTNKSYAKYDKL